MTPAEIVALLYPWFTSASDPRFVIPEQREAIQLIAANFRPGCLPSALQDIAQAHYAAHLMGTLQGRTTSSGSSGQSSGVIVREREGDVEVQYALPSQVGGALTGTTVGQTSYAAWKALNDRCQATNADGTPAVVVRRGAMITRWG